MRIALVRDVPDQAVFRRVEDRVQRNRQLNNTQTRAQMTTGLRHGGYGLCPQLIGDLLQLGIRELLQVRGDVDAVQQGGMGSITHGCLSGANITSRAR